jgi:hypothetical protein
VTTATAARVASPRPRVVNLATALRRESGLFVLGVVVIALHPEYFKAAGESKTLWAIPEAKHVGGLAARPAEYERRVIGFFDDALLS